MQRSIIAQQACGQSKPSLARSQTAPIITRRDFLASTLASTAFLFGAPGAKAAQDAQTVGAYLPKADIDGLVQFIPSKDKTPALRAGTIKPEDRYSFALPSSFKEARISNTQNGNFCQPKCAEPWTEVVFEDAKVGKIQLMAVPLLKLTNSKSATISDLGTPEQLLPRIGPYITGTYFDEDSIIDITTIRKDDGLDYYVYELNSPDALNNGPHSLTSITAKGEVVYLFILTANEKQWKNAKILRTVLDTFRA